MIMHMREAGVDLLLPLPTPLLLDNQIHIRPLVDNAHMSSEFRAPKLSAPN